MPIIKLGGPQKCSHLCYISNLFRVKFEYGKKTVLSFAKMENPEKNPFALPYFLR
jgi:hypothetical protein